MKKLVKIELLTALATKSGMTKTEGEKFLEALVEVIVEKTNEDLIVPIAGLGMFKPVTKKARVGRNPHTGESVQIKPSRTIGFKASPMVVKKG